MNSRTAGRQSPAHVAGDGGLHRDLPASSARASTSFVIGDGAGVPADRDDRRARDRRRPAWWSLRHGDRAVLGSADAQPARGSHPPGGRPTTTGCATASSRTSSRRWRSRPACRRRRRTSFPTTIRTRSRPVRDPAHASIAVTDGLLRSLNREELQGVVAHEMGHIRNLDIRLMMVVAALVGAIVLLADWSTRAMRFGGGRGASRRSGKGGGGGAARVSRRVAGRGDPRADHRPVAGAGGVTPARVSRRCDGRRAHAQSARRSRARSRRSRTPSSPRRRSSAAPRTCASPIRSASAIDERRGILGESLGDASADGSAHRRAERDGLRLNGRGLLR